MADIDSGAGGRAVERRARRSGTTAVRRARRFGAPELAILAVLAGGCGSIGPFREDTEEPVSIGRREVMAKEESDQIVAYDQSRCTISPKKWQTVKVGDRVWCTWRHAGSSGDPAAADPRRRPPLPAVGSAPPGPPAPAT